MIGIYKIENIINHHIYIGQSINIEERWQEHRRNGSANEQAVNKIWYNYPIYRAMRKYGIDNFKFTILEEVAVEDLNKRERYWIDYYNSYKNGYNATTGGDGHGLFSEEQKDMIIKLWNDNYLMNEISNIVDMDKHTVISILQQYEPSYTIEKARHRGSIASGKAHRKAVDCYDLYNNYLITYDAIATAAQHLHINSAGIIKCCQHQAPYYMNYRFAYHTELLWEIPPDKHLTSRPIYKIENDNEAAITILEYALKKYIINLIMRQ